MNARRRSFNAITTLFLNVVLLLWVALAVVLWFATDDRPSLRIIAMIAMILFWLLGTQAFASVLLGPLERRYPRPTIEELRSRGVEQVVVLSGGGEVGRDGKVLVPGPPVDSFTDWSRARFLAGADLATRLGPGCRLIFTGAAGAVLGAAAKELFPERTSVGESTSKETAHHPRAIAGELGDRPFAVVTSAFHMPRSMRVFRRNGLSPVAYPAGYLVSRRNRLTGLIPSSKGLELNQLAIAEYAANLFDAVIRP